MPKNHKSTHYFLSEGACILTQEKDGCILFSWDDVTEWSEVRLPHYMYMSRGRGAFSSPVTYMNSPLQLSCIMRKPAFCFCIHIKKA